MAKTVDEYLKAHRDFADGLQALRAELLSAGLEEDVKWGAPAYLLNGKNLVQLVAFKAYFGLWFHEGALLSDPLGCLVNAQEGKTQALRQWRFASLDEVDIDKVRGYVDEAIALERAGKRVPAAAPKSLEVPAELDAALSADKALASAFAALTPGRQREYAEHIGSAKREATRQGRLEKAIPLIRDGLGLNDQYRC
ncbi:MAG: YdeI/OmpD-associated family protein [Halieaceae bacterium]|jgi:uncharacterized protein YdeI (YjbR/CyaY-like superfamily)|nr:YdeI/OmpD-associated family protein [Halieaceae bacterium]